MATSLEVLANQIIHQLNTWLGSFAGPKPQPSASYSVGDGWIFIQIGDLVVWDSETCDDLTYEACRNSYVAQIRDLSVVLAKP